MGFILRSLKRKRKKEVEWRERQRIVKHNEDCNKTSTVEKAHMQESCLFGLTLRESLKKLRIEGFGNSDAETKRWISSRVRNRQKFRTLLILWGLNT